MVRHDKDGNILFHGDLSNRDKAWISVSISINHSGRVALLTNRLPCLQEWYCVQRVVLHNVLKSRALEEDISIHSGCKLARIDADEGHVELQDGRRFYGDVLLGADGVHVSMFNAPPPRSFFLLWNTIDDSGNNH